MRKLKRIALPLLLVLVLALLLSGCRSRSFQECKVGEDYFVGRDCIAVKISEDMVLDASANGYDYVRIVHVEEETGNLITDKEVCKNDFYQYAIDDKNDYLVSAEEQYYVINRTTHELIVLSEEKFLKRYDDPLSWVSCETVRERESRENSKPSESFSGESDGYL